MSNSNALFARGRWFANTVDQGQDLAYSGPTQVVVRVTANAQLGQQGVLVIVVNGETSKHQVPAGGQLILTPAGQYDLTQDFHVINDSLHEVSVELQDVTP